MRILLYNPDNGVTQNFMPHLWMFLLQALTPSGHEVVLIDGNTQPMSDAELVQFILDQQIGLVGIGAMTRMIAKAYRVADAVRAAGIPVVMGGPHVTEIPDEALGRPCAAPPRHNFEHRPDGLKPAGPVRLPCNLRPRANRGRGQNLHRPRGGRLLYPRQS